MTFSTHWREVPAAAWRWPNFSPAEMVNEAALDKLRALRDRLGKPLIVRSAYRSSEHNRVAQQALVETQGALQPLVPYLDTLSYDNCGSCAMREPLPATPFMAGSGGGRIGRHEGWNEPQRSMIAPAFSFGLNGYRGC